MTPSDFFGSDDPRGMPAHLFHGAIHLDYGTAIRGNPERQDYSVCPRHWYVDADFLCGRCGREFTWTAREQKTWFEEFRFWVDSQPRLCRKCRADRRQLRELRREYDRSVAAALPRDAIAGKRRIVEIVRELEDALGPLPEKMVRSKELFEAQIRKAEEEGAEK